MFGLFVTWKNFKFSRSRFVSSLASLAAHCSKDSPSWKDFEKNIVQNVTSKVCLKVHNITISAVDHIRIRGISADDYPKLCRWQLLPRGGPLEEQIAPPHDFQVSCPICNIPENLQILSDNRRRRARIAAKLTKRTFSNWPWWCQCYATMAVSYLNFCCRSIDQ